MAEKRKYARRASGPPAKKTRLSVQIKQESQDEEVPTSPSVKHEESETEQIRLPSRVYTNRPLPSVPLGHVSDIAEAECQSIEDSRVLALSLERSRQRWLAGEFFDRYWVKPPSNKRELKAIPANNPQKSWMKLLGRCTIIVEPLIFEANVYLSRDPAILSASTQQHQQQHQQAKTQAGPKSSATQPSQPQWNNQKDVPRQSIEGNEVKVESQPPASVPIPPAKNISQDPVIRMLAARASTDPNLMELMKVVRTGKAPTPKLQEFQRHIDELQAIVDREKAAVATVSRPSHTPQRPPTTFTTPQQSRSTASHTRPTAPSPVLPVAIEFLDHGASQDRFLFPPMSIVEGLGQGSVLASFLLVRKGRDASESSLFDPNADYFEPVTIKIDVEPRHSEVLAQIKRTVKPAKEVRAYMEEQMRTKVRAPMRSLPLQLPVESQLAEEEEVIEEPPPQPEPKKRGPYKKKADREKEKAQEAEQAATTTPSISEPVSAEKTPSPVPESGMETRRRSMKRSSRLSQVTIA